MLAQFDGRYEPHITRSLAEEYQEHKDQKLITELLLQISPLIGIVSKLEIGRHIPGDSRDSLCVDALEHVWKLLENGSVPTDSSRQFTSFLYTTIKRAMIDSLRECSMQVFDFGDLCEDPPMGSVPTYRAVDAKLQVEQIKDIVRAVFEHDCRFVGKELCACKFIALCLLWHLKQDPMAAQHRFKLTRARTKLLHQYTRIQVKATLYLIKSSP